MAQWAGDFGEIKTFYGLKIYWETAYASQYQIQVSNNASSWTTVYSTSSGSGGYPDYMSYFSRSFLNLLSFGLLIRVVFWFFGEKISPWRQYSDMDLWRKSIRINIFTWIILCPKGQKVKAHLCAWKSKSRMGRFSAIAVRYKHLQIQHRQHSCPCYLLKIIVCFH